MKPLLAFSLVALGLASVVAPAAAGSRFFASAGPTGTSDFGFRGGWGLSLGIARPIVQPASFVARADLSALPSTPGYSGQPLRSAEPDAFGESGLDVSKATVTSIMMGLRLETAGAVRSYLDALVGVGHLSDRNHVTGSIADNTNVALSFGTGFELPRTPLGSPFADVRYDFHFAGGADTPVVPVRLGWMVP